MWRALRVRPFHPKLGRSREEHSGEGMGKLWVKRARDEAMCGEGSRCDQLDATGQARRRAKTSKRASQDSTRSARDSDLGDEQPASEPSTSLESISKRLSEGPLLARPPTIRQGASRVAAPRRSSLPAPYSSREPLTHLSPSPVRFLRAALDPGRGRRRVPVGEGDTGLTEEEHARIVEERKRKEQPCRTLFVRNVKVRSLPLSCSAVGSGADS